MEDTFLGKWCSTLGAKRQNRQLCISVPQKYYKGDGGARENFVLQARQQTQRNTAVALLCLHTLTYIHMKAHNGGISCTFYPINTLAGCRAKEGPHEHCHN